MGSDPVEEIEFFRDAYILFPGKGASQFETVLIPSPDKKKPDRLFCSCSKGKTPRCPHARLITDRVAACMCDRNGSTATARFQKSPYLQIFGVLNRMQTSQLGSLDVAVPDNREEPVEIRSGTVPLVKYLSSGPDRERFISRCLPGKRHTRAWFMDRIASFVESDHERAMRGGGHLTVRQLEEGGLWNRIAYHCFREFAEGDLTWCATVDRTDGTVTMQADADGSPVVKVALPRQSVSGVFDVFKRLNREIGRVTVADGERELYFDAVAGNDGSLRIRPVVLFDKGDPVAVRPFFCYGPLCYLPRKDCFIKFDYPSLQRLATGWDREISVAAADVDDFFRKNRDVLSIGCTGDAASVSTQQTDLFGAREADDLRRLVGAPVITSFDRLELVPQSVENGIWIITVAYRYHNHTVELASLQAAKAQRLRYCSAAGCIVDLKSEGVSGALAQAKGIGAKGTVTLSGASLMVLGRSSLVLHFDGDTRLIQRIRRMFAGEPDRPLASTGKLNVTLRDYQRNGVAWLLFLFDNYLGGLLCDEMGLGKTVQVIAFLHAVKDQRNPGALSCVICPTSVASHWSRLVTMFAPDLRVAIHTSSSRALPEKGTCDVLLTTYGILRNDIERLEKCFFDAVVFDEVQQLKNSNTAGFKTAARLQRRIALGLTGTPVENSIDDLRTLLDLVMPGFSDELPDQEALAGTLDGTMHGGLLNRFKMRVAPFILRRLKKSVLAELPSKIEDYRYCSLSPMQRAVYNEAVTNRGGPLIEALKQTDGPIPYMHIFSLMSFLKQVCDTTALTAGTFEDYELHESGKWELFKELLDESLESGEKVVVFTQFLGMVEIIRNYLDARCVGCAVLTGNSRDRGEIVRRFSEDEQCRVFIGSLKAGGVGIDLVAASVVIHYDRWWNAAREDQATDRVHRIGQKRGVQVFKLVTENTIEERIASIIERKRELALQTLEEDDPETVKQFSRAELAELLSGV